MGLRLQEQQICGDRKQKGSCEGLKARRKQEFVFEDSEVSLWEDGNGRETEGGYLVKCGDGFWPQHSSMRCLLPADYTLEIIQVHVGHVFPIG